VSARGSRAVEGEVVVRVPATSANLGPGYDALGLALQLYDEVRVEVLPTAAPGVVDLEVEGEGAGQVPLDATHLVHRSMARGFEVLGWPTPAVRMRCRNAVPHGRGLGSSSAAIVAGLAAARALVDGGSETLPDDALFALAAELEGHPDNVAPAVHGGFTIAYVEGGRSQAVSLPVDDRVVPVALVPPTPLETRVARGLLPDVVPHADAAANAGRAALLVAALTGRPGLLLDATEDWLHQTYRAPAMPESVELVRELRDQGVPAVVSGAGPTVLALCETEGAHLVAAEAPPDWRALVLEVDRRGVRVERRS
jgi:homoserine kinase